MAPLLAHCRFFDSPHRTESSRSGQPSIAVLAFDAFSGEPVHEMLGAGFADDLITELARNSSIAVVARNTSFSVKGKNLTAPAIAKTLRVRYLVEGSIRRIEDKFAVNVQLIEGPNDRHLWAERLTISAEQIHSVQTRIVSRIASSLLSGIQESQMAASLRKEPSSLDAYELTLRGAAHERQQTKEGMLEGYAELERATALDPHYPPAKIWLGYLVASDAFAGLSGRFSMSDLPFATDLIRNGIALDPTLALGYQALGFALSLTDSIDDALAAAERSVELGPGDADNLNYLSRVQMIAGRYDEAVENVDRAIALNPITPPIYLVQRARALYCKRATKALLTSRQFIA